MNKPINYLVKKISQTNPNYSDLELMKMEYGLTCIFDEVTKIIPYFVIFYLLSLQTYYLIALIFFCPIRLFTGGYHAKTYLGCLFISFIVFCIIVTIGKYTLFSIVIQTLLLIVSFILVCIFSPVDNINKRIKSKNRRMQLKYFSIIVIFLLSILCYILPTKFLSTAVSSINVATILMVVGKFKDGNSDTIIV